jgi:UrcA family protein
MNTSITSKTRHFGASALLIAAVSGFAGIGCAADTGQLRAVVKYGDLNVSSPEGATVLYSRIRAAAEQVCRPFDSRDLVLKGAKDACVHHAMADAVNKVDQPALFSVYNAKNRISKPVMLVSR